MSIPKKIVLSSTYILSAVFGDIIGRYIGIGRTLVFCVNVLIQFWIKALFQFQFLGMGCGGTLYDTRGVVTSPNYPRPYTQQSNCEWTLKVPPGQKIQLRFSGKEKFHEYVLSIQHKHFKINHDSISYASFFSIFIWKSRYLQHRLPWGLWFICRHY